MTSDPVAFNMRDTENLARLIRARQLLERYNRTGQQEPDLRRDILEELLDCACIRAMPAPLRLKPAFRTGRWRLP